jgi:hypothetical protein
MSGAGGQSVSEALLSTSQLASVLRQGLRLIAQDQTVTFIKYNRVVLPYDGFVFWVRDSLQGGSAVLNTSPYNTYQYNQNTITPMAPQEITAKGSLHISTENKQEEDATFSTNVVVFTSEEEVIDLNRVSPTTIYIATVGESRFAFSERRMFYRQAELHHYVGHALYSVMDDLIIDTPYQLFTRPNIISNSLPLWLTLSTTFPLYPSHLVPNNLPPPYAAVHIGENDTSPIQSWPYYDKQSSRWQLVRDRVRVTFFGVRNDSIMDWLDSVFNFTLRNNNLMGIMNSPIPRDAKRGQVELGIIAQKKVVYFEVDYYQTRIQDLIRQLIKTAFMSIYVQPLSPPIENVEVL